MLLVDDDQAQLMKARVFLNERMRPHNQTRRPALDVCMKRVLLQARGAAGEHIHPETRLREEPCDRRVVLGRKNFRWRHEGHLQAVLHRDERRQESDDRLPGANIALQQSVHRLRLLHVFHNLRTA